LMGYTVMYKYLPVLTCVALAACAASPESIQPAYVSSMMYEPYSCSQLYQEEARLQAALASVSKQQHDARSGDAWGVALLGLPVSSFSGKNVASQVAEVKGNMNAVQEAEIHKNCGSEMPQIPLRDS
ncbi:MAG: hypothetical protein ABF968_15700, partial [Acetobacter sp.]|uniref:hypothetical protein n=1 Tax=Acetobacter sp. TaxID=440 RepID=UPI0039ED95FD